MAVSHSTGFNKWFDSLPEGRQNILKDDKWLLAEAAFEAGSNKVGFTIHDKSNTPGQITGTIEVDSDGISVRFDGYGQATEDGGDIIYVELWDKRLRVVVWPDINEEDPVVLDMEDARSEKYTGG